MTDRLLTDSEQVISLSASELALKIREGELSSEQVVQAHIKRIESVNKQLNAVVSPLFEQALI